MPSGQPMYVVLCHPCHPGHPCHIVIPLSRRREAVALAGGNGNGDIALGQALVVLQRTALSAFIIVALAGHRATANKDHSQSYRVHARGGQLAA